MRILLISLGILICAIVHAQDKSKVVKFSPDTTVNRRLVLLNGNSIIKTIGNQAGKLIDDSLASRVIFCNSNLTQYLILYHLEGGNANSFNEFEIGAIVNTDVKYTKLRMSQFITESNIRLGMTVRDVEMIKGIPNKVFKHKGCLVATYIVTNALNPLLRKQNMPEYRAVFYFSKNRLIKFIFGFPNL